MSNSSVKGLQRAQIDLIQSSNRNHLCVVAAVVLYAYDYLLTFSREVELIWRRKFTGVTVLFILNRYAGMPALLIWGIFSLQLSDSSLTLFSAMRIYAIWNREWRPALVVLGLGLIYFGILMGVLSTERVFVIPSPLNGCGALEVNKQSIQTQLYSVLYTCEEAHIKTSIATLILRDGTIISGIMLMLSLAIMVCFTLAVFNPAAIFRHTISPMLLSRFMLSLREVYLSGSGTGSGTSRSVGSMQLVPSIAFASNIVGVMGAPLDHDELSDSFLDADEDLQPPLVSDDPFAAGLWEVDADLDGAGKTAHEMNAMTRATAAHEVDENAV
ncbi:hypothetical protein B0H21DRAFT_53642 [Amylocystis lapponica]|nr:hypothetical protein B0H21DRAFT_53642 [Amylocystis lapponica]